MKLGQSAYQLPIQTLTHSFFQKISFFNHIYIIYDTKSFYVTVPLSWNITGRGQAVTTF